MAFYPADPAGSLWDNDLGALGYPATSGRLPAAAGTPITMTAVFTPGQVLMAAGFGAAYAAPYLGRLLDALDETGLADDTTVFFFSECAPSSLLVGPSP